MGSSRKLSTRSLAAILAVVALLLLSRPVPALFWPGFALSLAGAALRLWACGYLKKNKLLAVGGPYAHLKHPLYLGTFLGISGLLVAVAGPRPPGLILALAGFPLFFLFFFGHYFPRKRRTEGERMERRFGEDYRRWDREVPDFLPRLTPYRGARRQKFEWRGILHNSELGMFLVFLAGWAGLYLRMIRVLPP